MTAQIKCKETKTIFSNCRTAAEWLILVAHKEVNTRDVPSRINRMVNNTKFKISKTNGFDYPSWGTVRSIYGYSFEKVVK